MILSKEEVRRLYRQALEAHVAVDAQDLQKIEAIKHRIKETPQSEFGVDHATLKFRIAGRTGHDRLVIRDQE